MPDRSPGRSREENLFARHQLATGGQISPGDSPGAEAVPSNWAAWITGPKAGAPAFGSLITNAFFSGIVFENPKWDFQTLNFSSDVKLTDDKLGFELAMPEGPTMVFALVLKDGHLKGDATAEFQGMKLKGVVA